MRISMIPFLFFGLLLASCSTKSTPPPQTLRINIASDPTTIDPRKARNLTDVTACRMLFEGLTRVSQAGTTELAIAEAVDISEDRLTYTFHLKDTHWSNGEPVTSQDFADSWRDILDPQFPTDIAYQLYVIKNGKNVKAGEQTKDHLGIQTPDTQTLVVTLEQPTPYFLDICSMSSFLPVPAKMAKENPNWIFDPTTFVGNGPFTLKSWNRADQINVQKNNHYWDAASTNLQEIELFMVASDTEIRLYEDNKLDWAGSPLSTLPIDAIQSLKETNQLKVSPLSGTFFLRTNTFETLRGEKNPLSSVSFRKAIAYGIDREAIAKHILQGGQTAAYSLVPPEMGLLESGYFPSNPNREEILQLGLEELSLTRETLKPIELLFVASDRNTSIAQALQNQLQQTLYIPVELQAVESKVFFQRIKQKDFQLAVASWIADFNDPVNFLEVFKYQSSSTNNTSWENPKYIDLLNHSALCGDQDERKQILRQAEEILMDQMPIIPIFHFAMNFLQREGIEGIALSPIGQVDFRWAHIDLAQPSRNVR